MVVVVIAAAAGCGDNIAGPRFTDGAASGTRLKLRYYDFGSVRQLAGVRDTQRDEDCNPTEWADGKAYCVPSNAYSPVYADATCTQKVGMVFVQPDCTRLPFAYFIDYVHQACEYKPARIYPRGAKLALTEFYRKNDDGSCSGPSDGSELDFYALGPEVPVTDLAETMITQPSMTGRLGELYYESIDGLRYPTGRMHDALLDGACSLFYGLGANLGRCVPFNNASMYKFRDAACTQLLATHSTVCPVPKLAAKYGECPYHRTRYYEVTAKLPPTTVYVQSGMTCSPTAPAPESTNYDVGDEVMLATTSRTTGTGTDRIQPIHFTTPEGLRTRDSMLFDAQLGVECSVRRQADGTALCMPGVYDYFETYYTDPGCANAIELVLVYHRQSCSPPPTSSYAVKYTQTASCDDLSYEVRHAGTEFTGSLYWKNATTCTAINTTNYSMYRVGDVVPLGELAAGALVTDP